MNNQIDIACGSYSNVHFHMGIYKDKEIKMDATVIGRPYEVEYTMPIYIIGDKSLKKPITVKVIKSFDEVIGHIEDFNLYSFGIDDKDVLSELSEDLVDLLKKLTSIGDDKLGKSALKCKRLFFDYGAIE